jgi:methyl-accepting chemotaxis protein
MAQRPLHRGFSSAGDTAYSSGISAIVFMLFVVAGAVYIIAAKLGGVGRTYVTLVPVLTMIGYAVLIWSARSLRLRDDQAGDNLYYMGFLFTLTSLGVSLYQFNAARAAEEIVQNFGIAIGSTITGIALRVIFNQMRQDPVEVERIMRLELADAARRVRQELDSAVVEFGYFRRTAQQSAADSFDHVAVKIDEIATRLLAGIADVASRSSIPLQDASRRSADTIADASGMLAETLAATAGQLAADMEGLSKSVFDIAAAIDAVAAKLERLQTPDGVIEVRLDPVIGTLTGAVDRFAAESDRQAETLRDAVEAARSAAEGSSKSIAVLREHVDSSSAASRAAIQAAKESSDAVTQMLDQFNGNAWGQIQMLRSILEQTDPGSDMAAQAQGFNDILMTIHSSAETLASATERLADLAEDIGARRTAPKREAIG